METSKQPEALRLADELWDGDDMDLRDEAAAELRRQHAEIESLQAERDALLSMLIRLDRAVDSCMELTPELLREVSAAISTATGAAA